MVRPSSGPLFFGFVVSIHRVQLVLHWLVNYYSSQNSLIYLVFSAVALQIFSVPHETVTHVAPTLFLLEGPLRPTETLYVRILWKMYHYT